MNGLIKRMCILKQMKNGFSADGNPISGVVRVERYGKLTTVQLSLVNFAPLSSGKYLCILCDKAGEKIVFSPTQTQGEHRAENIPFNLEKGFCVLVAFVKDGVEGVAFGQYGAGNYNVRLLLDGVAVPEKRDKSAESAVDEVGVDNAVILSPREVEILPTGNGDMDGDGANNPPPMPVLNADNSPPMPAVEYDDDAVSESDYYARGEGYESGDFIAVNEDENACSTGENASQVGTGARQDDATEKLFRPFKISDGQTYYNAVKEELAELFERGERTDDLTVSFPQSEWVKIADADGCLVGIIYENFQPQYIAYALPSRGEKIPPAELTGACFVPKNPYHTDAEDGYFVLFQDVATGECVTVKRA